jgi:hypothetical protein
VAVRGTSVIPPGGDTRWRTRRSPALILTGTLIFDCLLVWLFLWALS